MKVPYNYLNLQFANPEPILDEIRKLAKKGDFTLGKKVAEFEENIAAFQGSKYAVGVSSGTDALLLILRALGIGPGDEVITVPNSFLATAAVIELVGAKIVFVDVNNEYNMDPQKIEAKITKKTKAIMPVHWTGNPADMPAISAIAKKYQLYVIEDAAQAIDAQINSRRVGTFSIAAEFSLHPIKNYNVWGDGGFIVTNDKKLTEKLKLMRNHGLKNRDECEFFAYNNRLHTIQAAVALKLLPGIKTISEKRIKIASTYDKLLSDLEAITIPPRKTNVRQVYHTYILQAQKRDLLVKYLLNHGVGAKVHYPIPLHLQKAAKHLGYKLGDFPVTEKQSQHIFSLPIHQYLTADQIEYVCETIHKFYLGKA
ncbi:DegT/DnrJ/EryC1/StrS family aminotransferase [Candidatus Daviesbacteria bacterium]|nr:DegT/DnrJ/EryC1/StrS family aminotransferase [Candidatus Daviesbacteria bacterium]